MSLAVAKACALALAFALTACGAGGDGSAPPAREWHDPGQARQGEWALYWNAYPTADLEARIASAYDVERRPGGAVVTVSLVRGLDPRAASNASVEIAARTLLGQAREVRTRRIERDGVVSWLGELDVQHRELLIFSITARLPAQPAPFVAEFRREFHTRD